MVRIDEYVIWMYICMEEIVVKYLGEKYIYVMFC